VIGVSTILISRAELSEQNNHSQKDIHLSYGEVEITHDARLRRRRVAHLQHFRFLIYDQHKYGGRALSDTRSWLLIVDSTQGANSQRTEA
jgi:hypothetical protein